MIKTKIKIFLVLYKIAVVITIVTVPFSLAFGTGVEAVDRPVNDLATDISEGELPSADTSRVNTTAVEKATHREINDRRRKNGLPRIKYDEKLASIAKSHSQDMSKRDYFAHESPDGVSVSERYAKAGYSCTAQVSNGAGLASGENLAQTWWRVDIKTNDGGIVRFDSEKELAAGIVEQWMNSNGHRKNILNPSWQSEGIGIVIDEENKVYATQNFC